MKPTMSKLQQPSGTLSHFFRAFFCQNFNPYLRCLLFKGFSLGAEKRAQTLTPRRQNFHNNFNLLSSYTAAVLKDLIRPSLSQTLTEKTSHFKGFEPQGHFTFDTFQSLVDG